MWPGSCAAAAAAPGSRRCTRVRSRTRFSTSSGAAVVNLQIRFDGMRVKGSHFVQQLFLLLLLYGLGKQCPDLVSCLIVALA